MEILFVTIVDRKIILHTTTGILTGSVMVQLERILSNVGFTKVEQSVIANLDKAKWFDSFNMRLHYENGSMCPVSCRNKGKVSSFFDNKNDTITDL